MYIRDPCEDDTLPKEKHTGLADSLFDFDQGEHRTYVIPVALKMEAHQNESP